MNTVATHHDATIPLCKTPVLGKYGVSPVYTLAQNSVKQENWSQKLHCCHPKQ